MLCGSRTGLIRCPPACGVDSEAPSTIDLAFLRGPTRAPVLLENIGAVEFGLTSASPEARSFFNQGDQPTTSFMYFSLVTITTLGYGDLSPAHEVGKFLATAEAVIGQVFLVTVVARLVSLYGMSRRDSADQPAAD